MKVETPYGAIEMKIGRMDGRIIKAHPEYEQCRRAARESNVSLRAVEEAARAAFAVARAATKGE
jgi:uncharacterized protein (DUF111 family)